MGNGSSKSRNKNRSINNNTHSGDNSGARNQRTKSKSKSGGGSGCCFLPDKKRSGAAGDAEEAYERAPPSNQSDTDQGGFEESKPRSVSVTKSRKSSKQNSIKSEDSGSAEMPKSLRQNPSMEYRGPSRPLQKNDLVVWVRDGRPLLGKYRWLGAVDGIVCAGLELTEKRTAAFRGETGSKKFSCKHGHRAVVPLDEVMLYGDYNDNMEYPPSQRRANSRSSSGSGVELLEGPTRVESEADRNERPFTQEHNWKSGDVILFRDTGDQAEIIKTYLYHNKLYITLKYAPTSSRGEDTVNALLSEVMAKADVIRSSDASTHFSTDSSPPSKRLETVAATVHSPDSYIFDTYSKKNKGTTYSPPRNKNNAFSDFRREKSISMYSDDSPPPMRAPTPPVQKYEKPSPIPWPTPPPPRGSFSDEIPPVLGKIPRVKENQFYNVKKESSISPSQSEEQTPSPEMSSKNRRNPTFREPLVQPSASGSKEARLDDGIDEVDVSYGSMGFSRDEELEYSKDWSKTHRKSQRQAAHKGIEAIFKKQIKAASHSAADREVNAFGFRRSSLTDAIKYPKTEDLTKIEISDIYAQGGRRPSEVEGLHSPSLVKRAQSSLSGSDTSLDIFDYDRKSTSLLHVSPVKTTSMVSSPEHKKSDQAGVDGSKGDIIFELSSESIPSNPLLKHSKRAKLTRQKPYPQPGTEVTSILAAEKSASKDAELDARESASQVGTELELDSLNKRVDENEMEVEDLTSDMLSQPPLPISEPPPRSEIDDKMDTDDERPRVIIPRISHSEGYRSESGAVGPERSSSRRRARTTPYSEPPSGSKTKSVDRKVDQTELKMVVSPIPQIQTTVVAESLERPMSPTYCEVVKSGSATPLASPRSSLRQPSETPSDVNAAKNRTYTVTVNNDFKMVRQNFPDAEIVIHPPAKSGASGSTLNQARSLSEEPRGRSTPTLEPGERHNRSLPVENRYRSSSGSDPNRYLVPVEIDEIPNGLKINEYVIWYSGLNTEERGKVLKILKIGHDKYVAVVRFDSSTVALNELRLSTVGYGYEVPVENLVPVGYPSDIQQNHSEDPQGRSPSSKHIAEKPEEHQIVSDLGAVSIHSPFKGSDVQKGTCVGAGKGIQGNSNSCYLDATLFSMFYCTDIFDGILLGERPTDNDMALQVKATLKNIVNQLRSTGYCSGKPVMGFRTALSPVCKKIKGSFMDAEEFMFNLFEDALHLPQFIQYSTDVSDFITQLLADKKDKKCTTVQHLLEMTFANQDNMKFKSTPRPALILQMPRSDGNLVHYDAIIPNPKLEISHLTDNDSNPKPCICGEKAVWECEHCLRAHGEKSGSAYCDNCVHNCLTDNIHDGLDHTAKPIRIKATSLDLLAVICIRSSHYVAFVKCGAGPNSPWLFFDSMAGGSCEVQHISEMNKWLKQLEEKPVLCKDRKTKIPARVRRILTDNHICIYYSP